MPSPHPAPRLSTAGGVVICPTLPDAPAFSTAEPEASLSWSLSLRRFGVPSPLPLPLDDGVAEPPIFTLCAQHVAPFHVRSGRASALLGGAGRSLPSHRLPLLSYAVQSCRELYLLQHPVSPSFQPRPPQTSCNMTLILQPPAPPCCTPLQQPTIT
jgi:hypothetical protein